MLRLSGMQHKPVRPAALLFLSGILLLSAGAQLPRRVAAQATPAPAGGGDATTTNQTTTTPGPSTSNVTTAAATLPGDITAVRSCLPFNILILPGNASTPSAATSAAAAPAGRRRHGGAASAASSASGTDGTAGNTTTAGTTNTTTTTGGAGNATIAVTADPAVIDSIDVTFTRDGILTFGLRKGFETDAVINLTITSAGNDGLRYVQNLGPGDVVVGPGFNVSDFSVAATSLGGVLADGITADTVYVTDAGTGTVVVNGTYRNAVVVNGGTARVYLAGNVSGNVNVNVGGISTTWIQGTSTTTINGTADGLARVVFTNGTCNVQNAFQSLFGPSIFGDTCRKAGGEEGSAFQPLWSCGLRVDGQSSCGVEASTATSASAPSGGRGGVNFTQSQPGGGTRTVTGPSGTVTTGTFTTPGGTASASGTTSGPGGSTMSGQTSQGGQQPTFTSSELGGLLPGAGATGGDFTGSRATAISSATSTGGPASSSSQATVNGQPVAAGTTGSGSAAGGVDSRLAIPTTAGGISVASFGCPEPLTARVMYPRA